MPSFGNGPSVSWTGSWSFESSDGQVGGDFVVPAGATYLTGLHGYVAGDGSPATVTLACWRGNTVIAQGTGSPATSGSATVGGQGWQSYTVPSFTVPITPGETLRLGWARTQSGGFYDWSTSAGGTWFTQNVGTPGTWSGASSNSGTIGAYADYTTSLNTMNVYINGVQLTSGNVYVNGASAAVYVNGVQL